MKTHKEYLKALMHTISQSTPLMDRPPHYNLTHKSQRLLAEIDAWLFKEYQEEYDENGLKFCPMCGGSADVWGGNKKWCVVCNSCDLRFGFDMVWEQIQYSFKTKKEAIEAWNKRV